MTGLLEGPIVELADLYRKKELSPVEVLGKVFERLEAVEPRLNAFIIVLEKQAIEQAKIAEKRFLKGETAHLLTGIPYSVKDLFYTKNIKTTCGSNVLKDFVPEVTAEVVTRLENAGAVLFGKNNMLEFAYGIVHPDYKQTNNPWDLTKTSGGSSSGSCAAVATGVGSFSLGTDTGGSIRIPASYCGVVGLKPTYGLVSTKGVFPLSWSLDHVGPIARTVRDVAVVLDVIAGHDPNDPHSANHAIEKVNLEIFEKGMKNIKVGILPAGKLKSLFPEVRKVYEQTLKIVESSGWELEEIDIAQWELTENIIMNVLTPEATHVHERWLNRKADYAPLTYQQIEAGTRHKSMEYINGLKMKKRYTQTVSRLFDKVDILLTPTVCFPAPAEDPVIGDTERNEMLYTGPFNISGHPAVTLNRGYTQENLPVGMQLVGKHFSDVSLLQTAYVLEQYQERRRPAILT